MHDAALPVSAGGNAYRSWLICSIRIGSGQYLEVSSNSKYSKLGDGKKRWKTTSVLLCGKCMHVLILLPGVVSIPIQIYLIS